MPRSLTDEEIEKIIETYEDIGSIPKVAEELGHGSATVQKYIDKAREEGDMRVLTEEEIKERQQKPEWQGAGPGNSPFSSQGVRSGDIDYSDVSPGEFIRDFFDDFEVGIKTQWVELQARRADRRGMIPSKQSLSADIQNMKSGIAASANREAHYIAEEYWAEAQRYIAQTGRQADGTRMSDQQGGHQAATFETPQVGGGHQQGYVGPHGGGGMQGGAQGNQGIMMEMMNEIQRLRQDMNEMKRGGGRGNDGQGTLERLQELQQEKEILEQLSGGDERLDQIEEQIMGLQQQMMQNEAGGGAPMPAAGDTLEDRLISMAASDPDVSLQEVLAVIEEREGAHKDPKVLEKEYEKQIKEMELEQQSERWERVGETAEKAIGTFGQRFAESLTQRRSGGSEPTEQATADGSGGASTANPDPEPAEQPQPQGHQAAQSDRECKHCGNQLMQTANGVYCLECEFGIVPCDLCSYPVEIPPMGEANFARCAECETVMEQPDDPSTIVTCDECEWEGEAINLRGELLECDNCGEYRPIERQGDAQVKREQVEELLEQ